jgi:signal transduction histidine kinase
MRSWTWLIVLATSILLVGYSVHSFPTPMVSGNFIARHSWNNYGYRVDVYHQRDLVARAITSLNGSFVFPTLSRGVYDLFVFKDQYCLYQKQIDCRQAPVFVSRTILPEQVGWGEFFNFSLAILLIVVAWRFARISGRQWPIAFFAFGLAMLNGVEFCQSALAWSGHENSAALIFPLKHLGLIWTPIGFWWLTLSFSSRQKNPLYWIILGVWESIVMVSWMWIGNDVYYFSVWRFSYEQIRLVVIIQALGLFAAGLIGLYVAFREELDSLQRNRVAVLLWGMIGYIGILFFFVGVPVIFYHGREPLGISYNVIAAFSSMYLVWHIGYVLTAARLLQVRTIICGSILYGSLTFCLGAIYALGIALAGKFFSATTMIHTYVVGGLILAAFPLKDRMQRLLDHYFWGDPQKELEQAGRLASLGVVAAGLAHEIKNPLTVINNLLKLYPERNTNMNFQEQFLEMVPRQVERINGLVQELLSFSKPSSLAMEPVDLKDIIGRAAMLLRVPAKKAGVEIEIKDSNSWRLRADAKALEQVIINLGLNALDAMPAGGLLLITWDKQKRQILVSDTGDGMTKEIQEQIFDPFFTTKSNGTGLGLSIVRRIVTAHQAKIRVDSAPERGTTFVITFGRRIV